jgi:hypothetical protein
MSYYDSVFVDLVRRMRTAQATYFRLRDTGSLEVAKKLEREVDAFLRESAARAMAPDLFEKGAQS